MATAAPITPWATIATEANAHREQVLEQLRQWGAALRLAGVPTPSRWVAAHDATARPYRLRIVDADWAATDRDAAEAAADDLWDAVASVWSLLRWLATDRPEGAPPVDRLVAELQLAGRWLASYRRSVAAHDSAIDRLFSPETGASA